MTFDNIVDHQIQLSNWIYKNLKPTKIIRSDFYNSFQILGIVKKYLPWVTHEELKQAMARCGFYADFTYCDSGYDALIFNVSRKSLWRLERRLENDPAPHECGSSRTADRERAKNFI